MCMTHENKLCDKFRTNFFHVFTNFDNGKSKSLVDIIKS